MQFDHISTACALVELVDVLGDEQESLESLLHCGKRIVSGIRSALAHHHASRFIPFPTSLRVGHEAVARSQFFGIELRPKPGHRVAKSRYPAFRRDARAGEHYYSLRFAYSLRRFRNQFFTLCPRH